MRIFLLRHGEAESHASSDSQRQLTMAGRQQVEEVARLFAAKEPAQLDAVLVSPYLRAQQTCNIFLATAFTGQNLPVETYEGVTPDSSPQACIEYLQNMSARSLLLVTHQPFVGALLELLTSGTQTQVSTCNPPMMTSSLACLDADIVAPGCAQLVWFSSPPHHG